MVSKLKDLAKTVLELEAKLQRAFPHYDTVTMAAISETHLTVGLYNYTFGLTETYGCQIPLEIAAQESHVIARWVIDNPGAVYPTP